MMTMDSLETFGKSRRGAIPDLLEPSLLTFCSDRGMMVADFEEICGAGTTRGGGCSGVRSSLASVSQKQHWARPLVLIARLPGNGHSQRHN